MCGEATPAPLIFQLIKGILGIGPIPIVLTQTENFVVRVGNLHGVLIAGNALNRAKNRAAELRDQFCFS